MDFDEIERCIFLALLVLAVAAVTLIVISYCLSGGPNGYC